MQYSDLTEYQQIEYERLLYFVNRFIKPSLAISLIEMIDRFTDSMLEDNKCDL